MTDAEFRILCWEGYEDESVLAPFSVRAGVSASGEHFLSGAARGFGRAGTPNSQSLS